MGIGVVSRGTGMGSKWGETHNRTHNTPVHHTSGNLRSSKSLVTTAPLSPVQDSEGAEGVGPRLVRVQRRVWLVTKSYYVLVDIVQVVVCSGQTMIGIAPDHSKHVTKRFPFGNRIGEPVANVLLQERAHECYSRSRISTRAPGELHQSKMVLQVALLDLSLNVPRLQRRVLPGYND